MFFLMFIPLVGFQPSPDHPSWGISSAIARTGAWHHGLREAGLGGGSDQGLHLSSHQVPLKQSWLNCGGSQ